MGGQKKSSLIVVVIVAALILGGGYFFWGRHFISDSSGKNDGKKGPIRIGVAKIISHTALNAIEKGIVEVVREAIPDVVIDMQNANGDLTQAAGIARKFLGDKVALAVGIATPMAVALNQVMRETPIIFSGVTDPKRAGLIPSASSLNKNITGYSDPISVDAQIDLLLRIKARLLTLGYVYSSMEPNSITTLEELQAVSEERGIELLTSPVTSSAEVREAAAAIAPHVGAFYVGTDNTVYTAISALAREAEKAGVPVMLSDGEASPEKQVLLGLGFDYYSMGRKTGEMVVKVLQGTPASEIPIGNLKGLDAFSLYVNMDLADQLKTVDIPREIERMATFVRRDGQVYSPKKAR